MTEIRVAKPGDLCVLLVPEESERMELRRKQQELAELSGGWIVPEPHITCQRFDLGAQSNFRGARENLKQALESLPSFTVYAAALTEFLSPFWGTYVLRWQVLEDAAWREFIAKLDEALNSAGCSLHYRHDRPPTCGAIELTRLVKIEDESHIQFPQPLFKAQRVMVTGILGMDDFETLAEFSLASAGIATQ